MKKLYYILIAGSLALLSSCHEPEFVEPDAVRQGITSLTAYFEDDQKVAYEIGKLDLTGVAPEVLDTMTRFEIPIMYYYPEESDAVTTLQMSHMRVRAELAPNCRIEPAITVLDLYLDNEFTYINEKGERRDIIITGKRVPFQTAQFLTFNLINPADSSLVVEGFVDNDEKIIYLFTIDDLTGLVVDAEPWYHGSVKDYEGLSTVPASWNNDTTVVAVAHDGVTEQEFKVLKRNPSKIKNGFNLNTVKELFNVDPCQRIGAPDYMIPVYSTLAFVDGYLAVCHGEDYPIVYVDPRNGSKKGEIATGGKKFSAITNDEGGNMLLCNHLDEFGGAFEIYRTSAVDEAPVLWYTYNSTISLPMGAKIKVCGDIDKDAAIVVCYEGVSGVTSSGSILQITVKAGQVVDAVVHDLLANSGVSWGSAPVNSAGVVPTNCAGDNGWFYAAYVEPYGIQWIRPDYKKGKFLGTNAPELEKYLLNPNALDSKMFNNVNYMALFVSHHFPAWAQIPAMWLYEISDPATVSGNYYQESPSIVAYDSWVDFYNNTNHAKETQSSSDVVIAQSKDGLRIYVYCYDHYAGVLCGYSADCVKRPE